MGLHGPLLPIDRLDSKQGTLVAMQLRKPAAFLTVQPHLDGLLSHIGAPPMRLLAEVTMVAAYLLARAVSAATKLRSS